MSEGGLGSVRIAGSPGVLASQLPFSAAAMSYSSSRLLTMYAR